MKLNKRHDKNLDAFEKAEEQNCDAILDLTRTEAIQIQEIQTKNKFPVAKGE